MYVFRRSESVQQVDHLLISSQNIHRQIHSCTHTHTQTHTHRHTHTRTHTHTQGNNVWISMVVIDIYTHAQTQKHTDTHRDTNTHTCIHIHVYIYKHADRKRWKLQRGKRCLGCFLPLQFSFRKCTIQFVVILQKETCKIGHPMGLSSLLQHAAPHCNTLQHTATHSNTQQHTATHNDQESYESIATHSIHNHTLRHTHTVWCASIQCGCDVNESNRILCHVNQCDPLYHKVAKTHRMP